MRRTLKVGRHQNGRDTCGGTLQRAPTGATPTHDIPCGDGNGVRAHATRTGTLQRAPTGAAPNRGVPSDDGDGVRFHPGRWGTLQRAPTTEVMT